MLPHQKRVFFFLWTSILTPPLVGQAGCQIGNACWELYSQEHGIRPDGYLQEGLDRPKGAKKDFRHFSVRLDQVNMFLVHYMLI